MNPGFTLCLEKVNFQLYLIAIIALDAKYEYEITLV